MASLQLLWWLIAGHFVADYQFQSDTVAREKNRHSDTPLQKAVPWYYWLTSHAATHGVAVGLITGSAWLGMAETLAHWCIDWAKCEKWTGIHVDQALHVACKVAWVAILYATH